MHAHVVKGKKNKEEKSIKVGVGSGGTWGTFRVLEMYFLTQMVVPQTVTLHLFIELHIYVSCVFVHV